ncbi:hypothetical protein BH11PSE9_BH11PSE9_17480 [soil metagenome]
MALERIAAIGYATPARYLPGTTARQPAMGETIELRLDAAEAGDLLATTADGLSLKLAGLGTLGRNLVAGDVLLVKVLATTPQLELALFDSSVRPGLRPGIAGANSHQGAGPGPFETEQAAMRPDQVAWLRQVVWRPADTAALASSWRASMLVQLERHAALRAQADGSVAASLLAAEPGGVNARDDFHADLLGRLQPAADPWLLAAYAWGGLRVMLRALAVDADGGPTHRQRGGAPALRVILELPGLGRVTVQLQLVADGVMLDLAADQPESLQPLRDRLPTLVAALGRVDLRVLRCRLMRALPGSASSAPWHGATLSGTSVAAAAAALSSAGAGNTSATGDQAPRATPESVLPPALFRAAAEVVAVLVAPFPPDRGLAHIGS